MINYTNKRDCLQASISFMTSIPMNEIPEFHLLAKKNWKRELVNWVNSIGFDFSEGFDPLRESWCLAICRTTLSSELHCVVCMGRKLVFDPSPVPYELGELRPFKYYYFTDTESSTPK